MPVRLPSHGLTQEQLHAKRYGLTSIAPAQCRRLAAQLKAMKEYLTEDIRLDRMPGIEQSGNDG